MQDISHNYFDMSFLPEELGPQLDYSVGYSLKPPRNFLASPLPSFPLSIYHCILGNINKGLVSRFKLNSKSLLRAIKKKYSALNAPSYVNITFENQD